MSRCLPAIAFALIVAPAWSETGQGYYRFPAIHGDTIVFATEGDLWKVAVAGGIAHRLTTHPGEESHPVISPDGQTLGFTATYEGPSELYTMPIGGGLPSRRTFEADDSRAVGWTPAGELVYTTRHYSTLPDRQLVALDLEQGTYRRIPLSQASEGSFDTSGRKLFFVRPEFHRNVTKRYEGGTARRIWKHVEGAPEAEPLTSDYAGESHTPMWWDGRVYFVTSRDGTMNIWSMDEDGGDLKQHTAHAGWDVKDPDLHQGRIVYQVAADIWIYDVTSQEGRLVPIRLASDFDQLREKWVSDPMKYLTSAQIHPKGESVVLTSRGRVFVAPADQGRLVRASRKPGVRYRDVVFMPDGKNLLALTDDTGELEFVTIPANGVGDPRPLTSDGAILRFEGYPSPDGKWIAYTDNNSDLWLLNVATKDQKVISTNREGVGDISWAPDSQWVAYSMAAVNRYRQLFIHNVEGPRSTPLTSDRVNSFSPAWSPEGEWLYFLSDRSLRSVVRSPWGQRQPEPFFDRPMKVYQVALQKGLRSPFKPTDELHPTKDKKDEEESEEREVASPQPIRIDLDGITDRVKEVPVEPGNYEALSVTAKALYWTARDSGLDAKTHLMGLEIQNQEPEPKTIVEDIESYEASQDGAKILVRQKEDLYVIPAELKPPEDLQKHMIDLGGWAFSMDVREDWRQIFIDAWRLERDYFYDPSMHGVDWRATLEKYLPLVERVTTRAELSDLIGDVVGELSVLHTSVRGGDHRQGPDDIKVASLGARLERDEAAGGYRIDRIYRSDPDYPELLSPLADPDLAIEEGDVIEAVNGVEALDATEIGVLLRNQHGKQVLLRVKSARTGDSREIVVIPTDDEYNLRYRDWEYGRRLRVEQGGEGKLGYVHLRAMGSRDLSAWYRQFYPVYRRQGLIIDARHNRGGNIDSIILEKLLRRAWFYWKGRVGEPYWNMQYAFRGHMVVLVNERTASDGEAFAEGFRRLGLGPLIGTRTWGGEVWSSSVNRLSDGGIARAPMSGVYGPEGDWLIEGHGVDPDIVVDNLPHETFEGGDAQLDTAIDYLLEKIRENPRPVPSPPPYPDKSFGYPGETTASSEENH